MIRILASSNDIGSYSWSKGAWSQVAAAVGTSPSTGARCARHRASTANAHGRRSDLPSASICYVKHCAIEFTEGGQGLDLVWKEFHDARLAQPSAAVRSTRLHRWACAA
jgi:hypothetical protein